MTEGGLFTPKLWTSSVGGVGGAGLTPLSEVFWGNSFIPDQKNQGYCVGIAINR